MEKIQIKSIQLSKISHISETITIRYDNSVNIIDEMGGEDFFYIELNTKENCAIKIKSDPELSLSMQFLLADYAGIYSTYVELKSFEGIFGISGTSANGDWSMEFHGQYLEESENIGDEDASLIEEVLNPMAVFEIANEVLNAVRK